MRMFLVLGGEKCSDTPPAYKLPAIYVQRANRVWQETYGGPPILQAVSAAPQVIVETSRDAKLANDLTKPGFQGGFFNKSRAAVPEKPDKEKVLANFEALTGSAWKYNEKESRFELWGTQNSLRPTREEALAKRLGVDKKEISFQRDKEKKEENDCVLSIPLDSDLATKIANLPKEQLEEKKQVLMSKN